MRPLDHAPEFAGRDWRNLAAPLDLRHDLAGRVVLLVFVAASCVHSELALATAARIDARFAGRPLAVIGILSPRVPGEPETAVGADLGVRIPLLVDAEMATWNAYGCAAWPTLVLIDGTGRVRYHGAGEPEATALVQALRTLLAEVEYGGYGYSLPDLPRSPPALPASRVAGLAVDATGGRLWCADASRHRVFALDLASGALVATVGCGRPGASDGAAADAAFYSPRGLALDGSRLLVADFGNHRLRAIDTETLVVDTIAGRFPAAGALEAPMAVVTDGAGSWLVAVAAGHRIVRCAPDGAVTTVAGTGLRGHIDGAAAAAHLAQPVALARAGARVAFCDAGTHALRLLDLDARQVTTSVSCDDPAGGDADGPCAEARLRDPRAVEWVGESLLVADHGNGRIRRVFPARGAVDTVFQATAPVALASAGRQLFAAVDGGARLCVFDLDGGAPRDVALPEPAAASDSHPPLRLRAYSDCTIKLHLAFTPGASLHPEVTARVRLANVEGSPLAVDLTYDALSEGEYAVVRGVTTGEPGAGRIAFTVEYWTRPAAGDGAHPQLLTGTVELSAEQDAPTLAVWKARA